MIKARGQLHMEAQPESAQKEDMGASAAPKKEAVKVNLAEGDYTVTNTQSNASYQVSIYVISYIVTSRNVGYKNGDSCNSV